MFFPAIGHTFEKRWPGTTIADLLRHLTHAPVGFQHVVVLDANGGDSIGGDALYHVVSRLPCRLCGMYGVAIVLADEDYRQGFEGREIQAFVEHALLYRAVTEETHHKGFFSLALQRIGITDRIGDRRSDHRRSAHDPARQVYQVHGPALALSATGRFAIQLSNHLL